MKRTKKAVSVTAENADLLVVLDTLAAIPPEACKCGSVEAHQRCGKCGACNPKQGAPCTLYSNYRPYVVHGCGDCGAKANMYSTPVYDWSPRPRFAASFGADLARRIRAGKAPSPKQIALAHKLAAEDHTRKLTAAEKPAIQWVTPRGRAWKAVYALVERDAFALTQSTLGAMNVVEMSECSREERAAASEGTKLVRAAATAIISERTGYDVLASGDDYADALKVAGDDPILFAALNALVETHVWLVREGKVAA